MLKELLIKLVRKKIELDLKEVAQTNHAAVTESSDDQSPEIFRGQEDIFIQFKTFKHIVVWF